MCVASVYLWFLFLIIYCVVYEYLPDFQDSAFWYGADTRTLSHGIFWLVVVFVTVISLLRDYSYKCYKRNYNPTLAHCVQQFEAATPSFNRFDVRKAAPYLFPKHEVKAFKPTLSEGVGNYRFLTANDSSHQAETVSSATVFVPRPEASPGR